MQFLKKLVKGQFSLSFTFWNFLILCSLLTDKMFLFTVFIPGYEIEMIVWAVSYVVKFIIACMAVSALYFMIKNKSKTFWYVAAFIVSILNLICVIYVMLSFIYILNR